MTILQGKLPSRSTALTVAGLAAWFSVTALSQHPVKIFDRLREYDPIEALIPNWRFFAPEPAQNDFHVFHRVLTAANEETPWKLTSHIAKRSWRNFIWFPEHRQEKGLIDICSHLQIQITRNDKSLIQTYPYLTMRDYVRRSVLHEYANSVIPKGFQFLVARSCGFDEGPDLEYLLVSPFIPLSQCGA